MNNSKQKQKLLAEYSNPKIVAKKAKTYLGANVEIMISSRQDKKYMVRDPETGNYVHFGQMGYEDMTKHLDKARRERYLARATKIKGDWKQNKYSANNLAIHLLW